MMLARTLTSILLLPAWSLLAGSGYFFNKADLPAGQSPKAIVSADFNRDGRLDLAVANSGDNTVSILLGAANASFQPATPLALNPFQPTALASADFDGDGKPDLAVVSASTNTVSIELGNGDGTFRPGLTYSTGTRPAAIAAGDFNHDGKPDLAIANYKSGDLTILLNAGGGSFMTVPAVYIGGNPNVISAGDFNGDGKADLAVGNASTTIGNITVLISNGDGTFVPHALPAGGGLPASVAVGDLNGDGFADVFEGEDNGTYCAFLGNGGGAFDNGHCSNNNLYTLANGAVLGDFNGDGKTDAVITNTRKNNLVILLGNGDGTFNRGSVPATGQEPQSLVAGDFNGDGKLDVAAANLKDNSVSVLLNNGNGAFISQSGMNAGQITYLVVSGDFNHDGNADLAFSVGNKALLVFLGDGHGGFTEAPSLTAPNNTYGLATGDFNHDGNLDLVTSTALDQFDVYLGNGDGTFTLKFTGSTGFSTGTIGIGDFNGDGNLDLAIADYFGDVAHIQLGNGDGTFRPGVNARAAAGATAVVTGDFNQDGILDLVVVNQQVNTASVLLGKGDGTFATSSTITVAGLPDVAAIGDFNGDGRPDLAVSNGQYVSVMLGNGDGTFQPRVDYLVSTIQIIDSAFVESMAAVDVNGDGFLDLVIPGQKINLSGGVLSLLPGNGDGTFGPPLHFNVSATGVAPGHFRTNSGMDLALSTTSNTPTVLLTTPLIALFPTALDFGSLPVGQQKSLPLVVSNPSGAVLHIGTIAVSGSSAFSQKNNCRQPVEPGGQCTILVTFAPNAPLPQSGTLAIPSNAGAGARQVPLSGNAK